MIALRCAGFDRVDLTRCEERGVKVARVPTYSPTSVAEHAVTLVIALCRYGTAAFEQVCAVCYKLQAVRTLYVLCVLCALKNIQGLVAGACLDIKFVLAATDFRCLHVHKLFVQLLESLQQAAAWSESFLVVATSKRDFGPCMHSRMESERLLAARLLAVKQLSGK